VLVNAEDVPPFCDAYALATVRRGNLVIGVSTEGRSPAVARALREWLKRRFGPDWEGRFEQAVALRRDMHARGAGAAEITGATRALLAPWLDPPGAWASCAALPTAPRTYAAGGSPKSRPA
jgi:precorrin-2 dehydrogenase / sirohydrochlorin ferrochelatase